MLASCQGMLRRLMQNLIKIFKKIFIRFWYKHAHVYKNCIM